jgi:polysaccharide biosynthesis protein PslG
LLLLLLSVGVGTWNIRAQSPWKEPSVRPAMAADSQIPHTLVNPYSVNTFLSQEVEPWKREKTMEMISIAGIGWIKEGFPWSEIEPSPESYWDPEYQQDSWLKYDAIVELAERHGVRVIARLDHTPAWARLEGSGYHTPPDNVEYFGRFVEAFVERYQGRVQYIQIWNEPNLAREWGGEIDPEGYFELLRESYVRAKQVDPNVVILSAPMAMTNETSARAIPEFDYWGALYELGASEYFDVLTATGYGIDQPPQVEPAPDVISLRRIELLRTIMDAHGDAEKAIWLTEYGWNASPELIPDEDLEWGRVSDEEQAEWTAKGIRWMDENWDWYGVSSIWYFRQVGLIPPDAPEYYFAMVDLEFTPRQVYLSVRDDALERRVALPGSYAPMESPLQQTGQWRREDDTVAPFGETLLSETWGSEIRIEFSGTHLTLQPGDEDSLGGWMYVTLNGEPAQDHLFSKDDLGRTYLDLDELPEGTSVIPVVDGYGTNQPQQTNTFVLHIHENARFSLRSVTVDYQRSYQRLIIVSAGSILGLVASLSLLRRRHPA